MPYCTCAIQRVCGGTYGQSMAIDNLYYGQSMTIDNLYYGQSKYKLYKIYQVRNLRLASCERKRLSKISHLVRHNYCNTTVFLPIYTVYFFRLNVASVL